MNFSILTLRKTQEQCRLKDQLYFNLDFEENSQDAERLQDKKKWAELERFLDVVAKKTERNFQKILFEATLVLEF